MPRYCYRCPSCNQEFEIIKRIVDVDNIEHCSFCSSDCKPQDRLISTPALHNTAVESPEYDPGLGMVIKSSAHRRQIAKERGLEEIGNESPDKIHKYYADQIKEKRLNRYKKLCEPIELRTSR